MAKPYKILTALKASPIVLPVIDITVVPWNLRNFRFSETVLWITHLFSRFFPFIDQLRTLTTNTSSAYYIAYCQALVDFFNRVFIANNMSIRLSRKIGANYGATHHQRILWRQYFASVGWLQILFFRSDYYCIPLNQRCFVYLVLILICKTHVGNTQHKFSGCLSLVFIFETGASTTVVFKLAQELNLVSSANKLL